jgi:hypothetical protein
MLSRVRPRGAVTWLVGLAITALVSGCGTPPSAADQFAHQHEIVKAWWLQNETAFVTNGRASLGRIYSGSGLEIASEQLTTAESKGSRQRYPRPFRGATIFAPNSSPSAHWFLAIVAYAPVDIDGRAQPITMTFPGLLFSDSDGTWKVIAADVQAPIPHDVFGTGDAVLSAPRGEDHYVMASTAIAAAFSEYLAAAATGSQPAVLFPTGPTSFAGQFTHIGWPPGSISTTRFTFAVESPKLASYSITNGFTQVPEVVIFVIKRTVVIKPLHGCLVRRADDIEWSDAVPAGIWSSITLTSLAVTAASVPLNDGDSSQGRKVIDISAGVDDISASGVRCG